MIALLRAENEELRKEQEIAWHHNPEMAKILKHNMRLQADMKVLLNVCACDRGNQWHEKPEVAKILNWNMRLQAQMFVCNVYA